MFSTPRVHDDSDLMVYSEVAWRLSYNENLCKCLALVRQLCGLPAPIFALEEKSISHVVLCFQHSQMST